MKSSIILFVFSFALAIPAMGQDHAVKSDSVEVIQDFKNLYRYQNFYLSGQPTYETLLWLKSHGVKKIINLRTEKENSDFAAGAFNEVNIAREMGFEYFSLPVEGIKDYTPEKLDALVGLLNKNDSTLIHCAGAGRVSDFFMAYLVKSRGYTVNEAIGVGRMLKFSMPLEKLLNAEINFIIADN